MDSYNQYVNCCVECNSLIEKGLKPNTDCKLCFLCENEEFHCFTNQKEKKIFDCNCDIYCHDDCMKFFLTKNKFCPFCHAKERENIKVSSQEIIEIKTESSPLIQTESKTFFSTIRSNCSSNINQYFGLLLFINMLIDLFVGVLYLVGITIENSYINKDVIVSVPIILLLIFDINILGSDIALLISRRNESDIDDETENNFDTFKHSLFSSSLIYFLSFIVSILVFIQPEIYSSLIVHATYALIVYQSIYVPRVFMYARN